MAFYFPISASEESGSGDGPYTFTWKNIPQETSVKGITLTVKYQFQGTSGVNPQLIPIGSFELPFNVIIGSTSVHQGKLTVMTPDTFANVYAGSSTSSYVSALFDIPAIQGQQIYYVKMFFGSLRYESNTVQLLTVR